MSDVLHMGRAARRLGVTPEHLHALEREGRIPPSRRIFNGRIYSAYDLALLKALGAGQRPRRLKSPEEVLGMVR